MTFKIMAIKRKCKCKKTTIARSALFLLIAVGIVFSTASCREEKTQEIVGGEIFIPDFDDGVEIYAEEGYSTGEEPHSIWLVSDEELSEEILRLCKDIKQYRQVEKSSDIMLGTSEAFEYFPRLYLVTNAVCYSIEILNWENYSGDAWSGFPIRQERFGKPTIHISRIDLSLMPEGEKPYSFAKEYFGADTVNTESGAGWYSTMRQESMDEVLSVLRSVGTGNAEEVKCMA